jgi:hypothetical protein
VIMLPGYRGFLHGAAGFFAALGRVIRCGERTYTSFILFWLTFIGIAICYVAEFTILEMYIGSDRGGTLVSCIYIFLLVVAMFYVLRIPYWIVMVYRWRTPMDGRVLIIKLISFCGLIGYIQYGGRYTQESLLSVATLLSGKIRECGYSISEVETARRVFLCYYAYRYHEPEYYGEFERYVHEATMFVIFKCINCDELTEPDVHLTYTLMRELDFYLISHRSFNLRGQDSREDMVETRPCFPKYYLTKALHGNFFALNTSIDVYEFGEYSELDEFNSGFGEFNRHPSKSIPRVLDCHNGYTPGTQLRDK